MLFNPAHLLKLTYFSRLENGHDPGCGCEKAAAGKISIPL